MKSHTSNSFRSSASIITVALASLVITSTTASAVFIYHDTASTDGGEFSATNFPIENLKNAGHTSAADTENAAAANESYATTNGPANGFPVTITLEFGSAVSLDTFYLWNQSNNGGATAPNAGVANFSLTFYTGASGTGSTIGSVYSSTASAAPATGTYAAQAFGFGSSYDNVRSIEFEITSRIGGGTSFVAAREIGFNQIPEPSSVFLGGLGMLALLRRRR